MPTGKLEQGHGPGGDEQETEAAAEPLSGERGPAGGFHTGRYAVGQPLTYGAPTEAFPVSAPLAAFRNFPLKVRTTAQRPLSQLGKLVDQELAVGGLGQRELRRSVHRAQVIEALRRRRQTQALITAL
jgi:hypothetical protein